MLYIEKVYYLDNFNLIMCVITNQFAFFCYNDVLFNNIYVHLIIKIINRFGDFMHIIKKPFLFCSSYSPLIIIMLLLKFNFNNLTWFEEFVVLISLVSIELGYIFLHHSLTNTKTGAKPHIIKSVENKNDLMHTYLLPYIIFIIPFGLSDLNFPQIIAIIILFILLCIIYIRSDLFLFDIILIFLGYNYYKISTDNNVFVALSKENLYEYKNNELTFRLVDKNFLKYGD